MTESPGTGFANVAGSPIGGVEDVKLLGGCVVRYLMGTESGFSCNVGATISLTDTTLLCILGVGEAIGVLVVATLESLAKGAGDVRTSIRPVGKTASVDCWMALDSRSLSAVLSCPVWKNIGTVFPLFGESGVVGVGVGVVLMPGNTQPSYS